MEKDRFAILTLENMTQQDKLALNTFARYLSKWKHNTYISMWSPPQNYHLPLNINTFVLCTQVSLGCGRVRSVHKMYTSFSWEMKGRILSRFRNSSAFVAPRWRIRTSNAVFEVRILTLGQLTSWRCDAIALHIRTSESTHFSLGHASSRHCDAFALQMRTSESMHLEREQDGGLSTCTFLRSPANLEFYVNIQLLNILIVVY